ncbi:class I SAM-dependent methyltransferase [Paludisphaera mucosa]|uniref:Class I SAM-dependent methyltransferase n=1 Tax=Paludisphaera mucosa TaxID=3030827 RepID=A0ABT6FDZ3_9BACT|nr:class I SAM-dependent methyltransferase [Paludisphaera mucosa]MDG3005793.1 class I SAM-dependent methyltransferase [Paludisphaera mucosa]
MADSSTYDELPYTDNCFYYTHPDHMATVASLHGLTPTPPERCRVLELGCAMGGNLIPMALKLPDARFVGIDLSTRQVAEGRATIESLGLRNVELHAMSITDVDAGLGLFDFIVCHGVYSWVPAPVRDKILSIFAENLAPRGLAYVSYNTFPGWHARGLARDLMAFHVRDGGAMRDSARSARSFLKDLVDVLPDPNTAYAAILKAEGDFLEDVDDAYLFHEHLEETNNPFYFHQFMAAAGARGLAFVAEAKTDGLLGHLPPKARERIAEWGGDAIAREQYADFVTNRTFRRTYLRRAADEVAAKTSPEVVAAMGVGTMVTPDAGEVDVFSNEPVAFHVPGGGPSLTTNHPLLKTALVELALARPRMIPFDELVDRVQARLAPRLAEAFDDAKARAYLCDALFRGFSVDLVALNVSPPRIAVPAGESPTASPLARLQAAQGKRITNIPGRTVEPHDLDRLLLPLLDGERDRSSLGEALKAAIESGDFAVSFEGVPLAGEKTDEAIPELIEASLRRLAAMGLLTS